jgi:hypothetical protein
MFMSNHTPAMSYCVSCLLGFAFVSIKATWYYTITELVSQVRHHLASAFVSADVPYK